ncbi:hypothetical protein ALT717_100116 [Alteromonas macleodii]|uniref:hypothetical protein n=1 Tax=Alteromonas sp. CyTr2 TaxID=2935039 RepID=UPI00248E94C6|nr:hypothetical protein [Alteromonas sp. CyTr2]
MLNWPPLSKITCYNMDDEEIASSYRGKLDLADSLMLYYFEAEPLECTITVSTKSKKWVSWNTENVEKIESHINYDLTEDGYLVEIERISTPSKKHCTKPFIWRLTITADDDDEEVEKNKTGLRYKKARKDASISTIQKQIEKVFGLPEGSAQLLNAKREPMKPESTIDDLRHDWLQPKPKPSIGEIKVKLKSPEQELEEKFEEASKRHDELNSWMEKQGFDSGRKNDADHEIEEFLCNVGELIDEAPLSELDLYKEDLEGLLDNFTECYRPEYHLNDMCEKLEAEYDGDVYEDIYNKFQDTFDEKFKSALSALCELHEFVNNVYLSSQ